MTHDGIRPRSRTRPRIAAAALAALVACALAGCSAPAPAASPAPTPSAGHAAHADPSEGPLVGSYDGGLLVINGHTLEVRVDIPLEGTPRLNPAGDADHVLVSTATGFRLLDAAHATLGEREFEASRPGHAAAHGRTTALFADGTGEITLFAPADLRGAGLPEAERLRVPEPHHGVAVALGNGELVHTLGSAEGGVGMAVLRPDRSERTRSEQCPGVHGAAVSGSEAVILGCEGGALVYRDGEITRVATPDAGARIATLLGSARSDVALGDYRLGGETGRISLVNTASLSIATASLPEGVDYSFRSLARGPAGEALVLGTDGALHVVDVVSGELTRSIPVGSAWEVPEGWRDPRPALFVREGIAYVSEPASSELHRVELSSGRVTDTVILPRAIGQLTGVAGHAH